MPTRAQRPRIPETSAAQRRARQEWNRGLAGTGRPAATVMPYEVCTAEGCGTPATDAPPPATGMVQVPGAAEGAPANWYCPGRCTVLARTRAEIRAIPVRPGGGR